jgi:hypothetical protein
LSCQPTSVPPLLENFAVSLLVNVRVMTSSGTSGESFASGAPGAALQYITRDVAATGAPGFTIAPLLPTLPLPTPGGGLSGSLGKIICHTSITPSASATASTRRFP